MLVLVVALFGSTGPASALAWDWLASPEDCVFAGVAVAMAVVVAVAATGPGSASICRHVGGCKTRHQSVHQAFVVLPWPTTAQWHCSTHAPLDAPHHTTPTPHHTTAMRLCIINKKPHIDSVIAFLDCINDSTLSKALPEHTRAAWRTLWTLWTWVSVGRLNQPRLPPTAAPVAS